MPEIVNGAPVVKAEPHVKKSRSRFPIQFLNMDTHRFGEYHPHVCIDGEGADVLPIRCAHDTRSYTLKAPLMQDIQQHKDYFMVNLRAILPFNGEKYYTNPVIGDDIPVDAGLCVEDFIPKVTRFISRIDSYIEYALDPDGLNSSAIAFEGLLRKTIILESIFSDGSLLSSLGCHLNKLYRFYRGIYPAGNIGGGDNAGSIDFVVDDLASWMVAELTSGDCSVTIDGVKYYLGVKTRFALDDVSTSIIDVRTFLEMIRDTSDWQFVDFAPSNNDIANLVYYDYLNTTTTFSLDIDLRRLWAYQLAIAEYMTDDHVDYVYNAELFRQYIGDLVSHRFGYYDQNFDTFTLNGIQLQYDYLSSHYFSKMFSELTHEDQDEFSDFTYYTAFYQYFLTLFGYKRSLRFKDYFVGARTRPLAVGDTSIPVVGGNVNVVDVSRNIQVQRFLNAINAAGRKFGDYIQSLFGVSPTKDMHEPIFLAHTSDGLFASENENTGDAQFSDVDGTDLSTKKNSVTAVFRGNSSNYELSVEVNEPCVIIGITSYDIERAYADSIDKTFFIKDRFDMFLPQLQFVGDQPVNMGELNACGAGNVFGYTFHDMQYKIIPSRAQGGFVNGCLPGYAFICDNENFNLAKPISPDFIRSRPHELDKFYLSLTGFSLGTYFHFIVKQHIYINASRPMAAQPQIL